MRNATMIKEINAAIGAHGLWKMRLNTAIRTGSGDIHSADACRDDHCPFGKWIHGTSIDAATRTSVPYGVIKRLHAEFHVSAGNILAHVERGETQRASQILESDYVERSSKLVRALTKWKGELS